ncbi:hypothetical protein ACFWEK_21420, partial [Isoptericola sp. NPDC060257]
TQASGGGLGDLLGGLLGGSSNTGGLGGMIGDALSKNAGGALGRLRAGPGGVVSRSRQQVSSAGAVTAP